RARAPSVLAKDAAAHKPGPQERRSYVAHAPVVFQQRLEVPALQGSNDLLSSLAVFFKTEVWVRVHPEVQNPVVQWICPLAGLAVKRLAADSERPSAEGAHQRNVTHRFEQRRRVALRRVVNRIGHATTSPRD